MWPFESPDDRQANLAAALEARKQLPNAPVEAQQAQVAPYYPQSYFPQQGLDRTIGGYLSRLGQVLNSQTPGQMFRQIGRIGTGGFAPGTEVNLTGESPPR